MKTPPPPPASVLDYLAALPPDRATALRAVRDVVAAALPEGYEEGIQYGHIGYYVPHAIYPQGYHCDASQPLPFCGLASSKSHMAVHMFCLYVENAKVEAFRQKYLATGKRLDMGASCVRFKKLADLPLELIGETIAAMPVADFIAQYHAAYGDKHKSAKKTKAAGKA